jgi:Na+(H+)/acetate symporter ActP
MNYQTSSWAVSIFIGFVAFVLWIAYYFAGRTRTSKGYYAAGGTIHWAVNGIAFAGDYLSAASFLGICGMIATLGYDGFLYSIGYLAGWIVALFVVAEPMKRMGKYTFTDALDSKFDSRGIQFAAALSTLVVSVCYLIPQMVGAGALITPLLGLPHYAGVALVGTIVIIIVASAGMASTTYVQFLKGGLLIVFSLTLVINVLSRGLSTTPNQGGKVPQIRHLRSRRWLRVAAEILCVSTRGIVGSRFGRWYAFRSANTASFPRHQLVHGQITRTTPWDLAATLRTGSAVQATAPREADRIPAHVYALAPGRSDQGPGGHGSASSIAA